MQTHRLSLLAAALLATSLTACSLTPAYERPQTTVPTTWSVATSGNSEVFKQNQAWWTAFNSPELSRLIAEANTANLDVKAAVARIAQARASTIAARSSLLPSIGANVSSSGSRQRGDSSNSTQASLSASYELDLWGANQASVEAAQARVAASEFDRDSVLLSLQAEVATQYFQLLALNERIQIAEKNRSAAEDLLKLIEIRFANGAVSALEVAQQRTTLLSIQSSILSLQQSYTQTQHALQVLLGKPPKSEPPQVTPLSAIAQPTPLLAPPVQLLERRPDIRKAEASLVAANANIGVARAALYPNITLSASTGIQGIFSSGTSVVASLAASLAQSIFDGGQRQAQVTLAEASQLELVNSYLKTVLTSLQDVEDSLTAISYSEQARNVLEQTAKEAQNAYRLSKVRFDNGTQDMVNLLDSQRSQLSAEDALVQNQQARLVAAVNLFKALGGGWVQ